MNKKKYTLEPKRRVAVIWACVAVVCGHSRLVQGLLMGVGVVTTGGDYNLSLQYVYV
jgi:hypothetical protein